MVTKTRPLDFSVLEAATKVARAATRKRKFQLPIPVGIQRRAIILTLPTGKTERGKKKREVMLGLLHDAALLLRTQRDSDTIIQSLIHTIKSIRESQRPRKVRF